MPRSPIWMLLTAVAVLLAGCATGDMAATTAGARILAATPAEFCAEALRIVSNTGKTGEFVVHPDFNGFVQSKTSIDPPTPCAKRCCRGSSATMSGLSSPAGRSRLV